MATTSIEWTDATWNPVRGCTKVSPGCANCYAETFAERFRGVKGHPYEQGFDLRLVPEKLTEPLTWKKPRRVFVNSMSDLFQDGVPDAFIAEVFAVMAVCGATEHGDPDSVERGRFGAKWNDKRFWYDWKGPHTFQVLTKRPARMHALLTSRKFRTAIADAAYRHAHDQRDAGYLSHQIDCREEFCRCYQPGRMWPLSNVWLGVSVENQHFADERIPLLLQTPATVRFISAEPLLGPIDILQSDTKTLLQCVRDNTTIERGLDWVIVGGESGPKARHFDLAWARSIIEQCQAARVPVFVKQLGAMPFDPDRVDEKLGYVDLKSRKGGDMAEWPEDLRVREFPEVRV